MKHRIFFRAFQDALNHMVDDISHYIPKLSPLTKKEIRGKEVFRFEQEDSFHAIVLKLILLRRTLDVSMHLRENNYVYFSHSILRFWLEIYEDIHFLIYAKNNENEEEYKKFLEAFFDEGEMAMGLLNTKNTQGIKSEKSWGNQKMLGRVNTML